MRCELAHLDQVQTERAAAFPSGHAASAFAFAYTVSRHYPLLAVPLGLLAGAVAFSRVHTGVHSSSRRVSAHTRQRWILLYLRRCLTAPLQRPDGTLVQRDRRTRRGRRARPQRTWQCSPSVSVSGCCWRGPDGDAVPNGDLLGSDEDVFDEQPLHVPAV